MSRRDVCAHPGCHRLIGASNRSGVCFDHTHQQGCACVQCGTDDVDLPPLPPGVATDEMCPIACRRMWADAVRAIIADGAYDLAKARLRGDDIDRVRQRLRSYFTSRDCGIVVDCAGLDLSTADRATLLMDACERQSHLNTYRPAHVKSAR